MCEIPFHKYFVSTPVHARARFSLVWQLAKPPSYWSSGQSRTPWLRSHSNALKHSLVVFPTLQNKWDVLWEFEGLWVQCTQYIMIGNSQQGRSTPLTIRGWNPLHCLQCGDNIKRQIWWSFHNIKRQICWSFHECWKCLFYFRNAWTYEFNDAGQWRPVQHISNHQQGCNSFPTTSTTVCFV